MKKVVKILSLDGGGIRGIIPALVLAHLEDVTGQRISEMFDLIAGTSTGGILAMALTVPGASHRPRYWARDIADMYEHRGNQIFSRSLWHRFSAWNNLAHMKYPHAGIDQVLLEYFGDARLSEALTDVLVTSYEIERSFPFFFKSSNARRRPDYDYPMRHVARATSAAPTYFEPVKLPTGTNSEHYTLIDGGVFANNPAACALVEARTILPDADEYLVVSLGTGALFRCLPYEQAKHWGLAQWARPVLSVVFDGVSSTVDYQLRKILHNEPGEPRHYYRFQTTLDGHHRKLDDTSSANITALKALAYKMIRNESDELEQLCEVLATTQSQRV